MPRHRSTPSVALSAALSAALLALLAAPALAAGREALVAPVLESDVLGRVAPARAAGGAQRVELRLPRALPGEELALWLPDGRAHTARIDAFEKRGGRVTMWGRVDPWRVEEGFFVATSVAGRTVATLVLGDRSYRIRPAGAGHVLAEAEQGSTCAASPFAPRSDAVSAVTLAAAEPAEAARAADAADDAAGEQHAAAKASPTIDVLVFYTAATRDAAGGDANAQLEIQHAVDFTNFAFANSLVTARLRLAAARPIDYAETTPNGADDLLFLHASPAVAAQREEQQADLVGIVKSRWNGISGGAVSMTPTMKGAAIAPMAFFQTNLEHMPGNFAHEVGHNFGLQHERGEPDPTPGPLPYAYAYALDPLFRTIMVSGSNPCRCPTIPHYSNPKVRYGGVPTGIPNDRDNARALRVMAPAVATFGSLRGRVVARATAVAVAEGAAELVVDLYRVDGSIGPVAMGYSTRNGTAKSGQDFVAAAGELEWASGEADVLGLAEYGLAGGRRIVIPLLDDGQRERKETFWIELRSPRGGARLGVARIKVTLTDDD